MLSNTYVSFIQSHFIHFVLHSMYLIFRVTALSKFKVLELDIFFKSQSKKISGRVQASRNFYPSISCQIPLSNNSFHTTPLRGWIIKTEMKTGKCDINLKIIGLKHPRITLQLSKKNRRKHIKNVQKYFCQESYMIRLKDTIRQGLFFYKYRISANSFLP